MCGQLILADQTVGEEKGHVLDLGHKSIEHVSCALWKWELEWEWKWV